MSVQSEIDRIKKNVDDTLKAISDTGVQVGMGSDALPAAARALANEKQDKLTGTVGQLVGFDEKGNAIPQNAPQSGMTQTQADERYLQLSGGVVHGDVAFDGTFTATSYAQFHSPTVFNGEVRLKVYPEHSESAANKEYVDDQKPKAAKVTLTTAGWDSVSKAQKVTVRGVLADEGAQLIMPMPAMASQNDYAAAGIACTLQEANALTFKCQTVPTADIAVFVTVQEVRQG
jgi:hypothetical protein